MLTPTACLQLSQMFMAIAFFHSSEYLLAAIFHGRSNITLGSLLISKGYVMAMCFSILAYLVEVRFFPHMKEYWWISYSGLVMVVTGEIIRKMAIVTAGFAFTHLIRTRSDERHQLVKHGIYRFMRHPGYCSFLVWSVGTQIMLCSPVSAVGFAAVVWHFFYKRIPYEEHYLIKFFGEQYVQYSRQVPSGSLS